MATITQSDFAALTDDLQSDFRVWAKVKIAQMTGFTIFGVEDVGDRRTHDHLVLHGVGGFGEVTPGADIPTTTTDQGDTITWTQKYYGNAFEVTKEMRKFDLRSAIIAIAKSQTEDAFDKIDQHLADCLTFGTSTSFSDVFGGTETSTGPDGLALFNASHTHGVTGITRTYRNIIQDSAWNNAPAVSRDAIDQMWVDAMNLLDAEGHVRPTMIDTVVVAPRNADIARRIVFSSGVQGTANVDINPIKSNITEVKIWPRLTTRTGGTTTSDSWFGYDSRKVGESVRIQFSQKPILMPATTDPDNLNWKYIIDAFFATGRGYQAYIFGAVRTG